MCWQLILQYWFAFSDIALVGLIFLPFLVQLSSATENATSSPPDLAISGSVSPSKVSSTFQEELSALNSGILPTATLKLAEKAAEDFIGHDAAWPAVPIKIVLSNYPDINFFISKVTPMGTPRERGWQSVTLETLQRVISQSSEPGPIIFTAGQDDLSIARVTEAFFSKGRRGERPAVALGLRILNSKIVKLPAAQIQGYFCFRTDRQQILATFEAFFSNRIPPIPEQWIIWPTELPTPPATGKWLLVSSSLPNGDGWDLKHVALMLQKTLDQLQPFKASGQTLPIAIETATPGMDWKFSNHFEGYAGGYTLDMQLTLLAYLRQLILIHGVSELRYDLVNEENESMAGGVFRLIKQEQRKQIEPANGTAIFPKLPSQDGTTVDIGTF